MMKKTFLIKKNSITSLENFSLTINGKAATPLPNIEEGDVLLVVDEKDRPRLFARVYRVRETMKSTTIYFDAFEEVETEATLETFGVSPLPDGAVMGRVEWDRANEACRKLCGVGLDGLRGLDDYLEDDGVSGEEKTRIRAYVRTLLELAVADDLLGPAMGPHEEVVGMSVRDRYLLGKLAPKKRVYEEPVEELEGESGYADADDSTKESVELGSQSLVPSSFGLTFCVDGDAEEIEVEAEWGRYVRTKSEEKVDDDDKPLRCWKRIPSGGSFVA
jgi:hypothetical protein